MGIVPSAGPVAASAAVAATGVVAAAAVAVAVVGPAVEIVGGRSLAHQKDHLVGKRQNLSRFHPVPQIGSETHWIGTGFGLVATAEAKSVARVSRAVGIAETWD